MELTILGCHSATPRQNFHTSSQLLNFKNHLFMIDCGEGSQIRLREEKIRYSNAFVEKLLFENSITW